MDNVHSKNSSSLHIRLARLARPYWAHLAGIFLLGAIGAPIGLLLAFPLKVVVDNVIGDRPLPRMLEAVLPSPLLHSKSANLLLAVGLLLVLSLLTNLQSFVTWLLQTYTGEKLVVDLRTRLFWHVQRMDLLFHDRRGANDVAYRIQHDAPAIQYLFLQGAVPLVSSGRPARTSSSRRFFRVTTPESATADAASPAGSASGWAWPALSSKTRRS